MIASFVWQNRYLLISISLVFVALTNIKSDVSTVECVKTKLSQSSKQKDREPGNKTLHRIYTKQNNFLYQAVCDILKGSNISMDTAGSRLIGFFTIKKKARGLLFLRLG